jgi:hypothetical protein
MQIPRITGFANGFARLARGALTYRQINALHESNNKMKVRSWLAAIWS